MALACLRRYFGICMIIAVVAFAQEPSCYTTNRFEYEFKVLQKLDSLEKGGVALSEKYAALVVQLAALELENKGMPIMHITFNTIELEKKKKGNIIIAFSLICKIPVTLGWRHYSVPTASKTQIAEVLAVQSPATMCALCYYLESHANMHKDISAAIIL